jgi:hypothetical protein
MGPMPVVMGRKDMKHVRELAAAEDEQPVEALATHAADPSKPPLNLSRDRGRESGRVPRDHREP